MSDDPQNSGAWTLEPAQYLASRSATHSVPQPISLYLKMADGVKLAVDIYVPQGDRPEGGFPALLHFTPYYRRFALKEGAPATAEACPNVAKFRDVFVPRGYAMVVVDVRGTGASFGARDSFRSPTERDDSRTIMDWVVAQKWSNGTLGATGISYVGAAADFAATTGHKALKAIAPISAVWDTCLDQYYPGGLLFTKLASAYDKLMQALDLDRRKEVAAYPYFADPDFSGPAPVDDDANGELLARALSDHAANVSIADFINEFPYRDSTLPYDESFSAGSFSPCTYSPHNNSDLAVLSISGWMDGGYMNGSIARFLTLAGENDRLLLGPWDHGARTNVSPFREQVEPQFSLLGEILRFFDEHLQQRETGLRDEARVHYFSFASECWKSADSWPPAKAPARTLHLAGKGQLAGSAGPEETVSYRPDFGFGTGQNTRYGRLAALDITEYYPSWEARSDKLLRFAGEPLEQDITVTGHPVLTLKLESDQADAAVIVYLEDIAPDGKRRYVTEGILRALHRKESAPPETYKASWPYHSCLQADAAPLAPGEPALMRIAMLPTSWCFRAG
ncbi:MAG: CocE/NonD family hydrolase, partial [Alphaproteobacteria bacterium]